MISLVTFCDSSMTRAADLCVRSAREHGADSTLIWTQDALKQTAFYRENKALLDQPRGCGYWSFKPWIVFQLMLGHVNGEQWTGQGIQIPKDGDVICYMDAGVATINNLNFIVDRMGPGQDVWAYANEHLHARWCKADIIESVWPFQSKQDHDQLNAGLAEMSSPSNIWTADFSNLSWARFGYQAQASVIAFRISDYSRAFVAEWLKWCIFEDGRLIDDSPSRAANHSSFIENRHDQAVFSTMIAREKIAMHGWFPRYLNFEPARVGYPEDAEIPRLFLHHRLRDANWHEYESRAMR